MKNYSNLGQFRSKGRLFKEPTSKYRSIFQRDRDRVVHSASFRRLKHKTQVFVNTEGDHYRTRITHSLEVAQIARSVSKYLNLNEDLSEVLSLAHDLGHTPFGHAGENALDECMVNYGGFNHNLQTLRIVMFLENKYFNFNGLNLSIETLDGLLKHNGPVKNKLELDNQIGIRNFKNKINFDQYPSLESQISAIADDIAYNNHDILDGIKSKTFKFENLLEIKFFSEIFKKYSKKNKNIMIYQVIRDSIDLMVKDLINNIISNLKKNKVKTTKDIYLAKKNLVCFSDKFLEIEKEIKNFLNIKMYKNKIVLKKNENGKKIIKKLFKIIEKKPKKFINKNELKVDKYRAISDYIAGMTDRYAINLYNKLK
tara:strand:+ start:212 stop:1318 length:1107 start_codon:yes stop_codon:yes gene_type:complete